MPRILFLDDEPRRYAQFWQMHKKEGVLIDHAKTVDEAVALLSAGHRYDLVSLDNDLTDAHYGDQESDETMPGSGEEVAMYISGMENPPPVVIVHTWNSKAALRHAHWLWGKVQVILAPFGAV